MIRFGELGRRLITPAKSTRHAKVRPSLRILHQRHWAAKRVCSITHGRHPTLLYIIREAGIELARRGTSIHVSLDHRLGTNDTGVVDHNVATSVR
jgi:hypothetical protein